MFTTYMHARVCAQPVTHFLGITQTHAKRAHVHALLEKLMHISSDRSWVSIWVPGTNSAWEARRSSNFPIIFTTRMVGRKPFFSLDSEPVGGISMISCATDSPAPARMHACVCEYVGTHAYARIYHIMRLNVIITIHNNAQPTCCWKQQLLQLHLQLLQLLQLHLQGKCI